ncbi:MAG: PTS transporter subunit EIIC [Bdellovibrionales bacterium]|nr:PTS transporter subunit EIIC [Oligoflexia bacterium]
MQTPSAVTTPAFQSAAPAKPTLWNRSFSFLQRLGQALMLPVSVLPAAGLMVALGRVFTDFTKDETSMGHHIGKVLYTAGLSVFEQLALIFAIGVALGFTGMAGISGLAAVTGFFAFSTVLKAFGDILHLDSAINTGVLGGICVGALTASLYNRYHSVKLPQVLGFFSGKRLIPILSVFASVALALIFVVIWPPIQTGIHNFGESVMGSEFGPSIYASVKRLLIPVGLHHVFYPSFLYEFGEFTTSTGKVVHGEATRYFAGDASAGRFMASEFPMMIFGLPAAALAMTLRAKPERRKMIAGIMLSAALTSIITGITEPIEFAFTFVAPLLYVIHACLAFLSGYLTNLLDIHLGYTFSSSLIDLALGYFNQKNISLLFLVVGPIIGLAYFSIFYWAIGYFNFKTPGREDEEVAIEEESPSNFKGGLLLKEKAAKVLTAIGGQANIVQMEACITRLRLQVNDSSQIDQAALKRLGAAGVMNAGGGNVQIVFGVESDLLKTEIQKLMTSSPAAVSTAGVLMKTIPSPIKGTFVALADIPDATFSAEFMGKTLAILPIEGIVYAPFDGTVATLFHTNHAIGLESNDGLELLIHIGIDTVKMNGQGFKAFVKMGDTVTRGQKLIEFDLEKVKAEAKSLVTPIVITNPERFKNLQTIQSGETLWKYN